MKKIIFLPAIIAALFMSMNLSAKNTTQTTKSFSQTFHHAKNVHRFEKNNGGVEYDFLLKGKYVAAFYDASGNLVETDYSINYKKLPEKARTFLKGEFANPTITEITRVENKQNFFYRIFLENNGVEYSIVVTPTGEVTMGY